MVQKLTIFILSLLLINLSLSTPEADHDIVDVSKVFPDYKFPFYSGYLNTKSPLRKLHYAFAPSQSATQKDDPLVLWMNGGPGCSSMLGMLQEHGPVIYNPDTGKQELNPYSWNKVANMLYLEAPAGVGFSINNDKDFVYNDDTVGQDNLDALLEFFKRFPEYNKNQFFIAGESYAGVYVPKLASMILLEKVDINLEGILVGNGLTDYTVDVENATIDFAWDHALYSIETRQKIETHCPSRTFNEKENNFKGFPEPFVTPECNVARNEISDALYGLNVYDVYRKCDFVPEDDEENFNKTKFKYMRNTARKASKLNFQNQVKEYYIKNGLVASEEDFEDILVGLEEPVGTWPKGGCKEDLNPINFLNDKVIQDLLHVEHIQFAECDDPINENYVQKDASIRLYQEVLLGKLKQIQFFSGDTDAAVPITGTVRWIPKLKLDIVEEYRAWGQNQQTLGYVQRYSNEFTFVTIKGTGHMAPQWKPAEVFIMIQTFLKNGRLPKPDDK